MKRAAGVGSCCGARPLTGLPSLAMASKKDAMVVHRARFVDFKPKRVTALSVAPSHKLLAVSYSTAEVCIFRVVDSSHVVPLLVRGGVRKLHPPPRLEHSRRGAPCRHSRGLTLPASPLWRGWPM